LLPLVPSPIFSVVFIFLPFYAAQRQNGFTAFNCGKIDQYRFGRETNCLDNRFSLDCPKIEIDDFRGVAL
jgi:hypothetical protein